MQCISMHPAHQPALHLCDNASSLEFTETTPWPHTSCATELFVVRMRIAGGVSAAAGGEELRRVGCIMAPMFGWIVIPVFGFAVRRT